MTQPMTIEQMQLIKRTAWMNIQAQEPNENDMKYIPDAIRMLTYIAALNSIMYELVEEVEAMGLYRQDIKRRINQVHEVVRKVHSLSYTMLNGVSVDAGRQYNDAMEKEVANITNNISLEAPERAYNIVLALIRLIEKYNKKISPRYDFKPSHQLSKMPALLSCIPIRDYGIDRIIELNYRR